MRGGKAHALARQRPAPVGLDGLDDRGIKAEGTERVELVDDLRARWPAVSGDWRAQASRLKSVSHSFLKVAEIAASDRLLNLVPGEEDRFRLEEWLDSPAILSIADTIGRNGDIYARRRSLD